MAEYSIAGWYDEHGDWHDVEENPDEAPSWNDLENSAHITIRYEDSHGDIYYRDAISYVGFDEADLEALADSFEDRYDLTPS